MGLVGVLPVLAIPLLAGVGLRRANTGGSSSCCADGFLCAAGCGEKLERNPIGWLEQRTWSGRLVTWGWFAVMISIYSAAFSNTDVSHSLDNIQRFMGWLLLGVIAVTAAGSFRRERETGVMELLLVSPMSVRQIIGGRLRGLWGQFLPAFPVCSWESGATSQGFFPGQQAASGLKLSSFVARFLPCWSSDFTIHCGGWNFISAFVSTIVVGAGIPFGIQILLGAGFRLLAGMNGYYFGNAVDIGRDDSLGILLLYALLRLIFSPLFVTIVQLGIAARIWRAASPRFGAS